MWRETPVTPWLLSVSNAASELLDNVNVGNLHMLGMRSLGEFIDRL
jgi:hypothetical protein